MTSETTDSKKVIIVIGAGVIGLTTALRIQETGKYHVTIIAETLPSDPLTIRYTSQWAGAIHSGSSHAYVDEAHPKQSEIDSETFKIMWDLSAPGSEAERCFKRLTKKSYYGESKAKPYLLESMPDFRYMDAGELVEGSVEGVSFSTFTIDVPIYLNYLLSRFLAHGGAIVRGQVQHVSQVMEDGIGPFTGAKNSCKPAAVVACVGLGARFLGGIEDKNVTAIRGQTILLRAPWVDECIHTYDGPLSYVIPRRSGDVVIGGTYVKDDWYPLARLETRKEILARILKLYPKIAPPEIRAIREPAVEDIEPIIIEDRCGLRPGRKQGIRIDVDTSGAVPLVLNYGHGGYGYISSWGSASVALELLDGALDKKT
ncbi:D-aspartate oxidase [Guyanagaster necrorhizus]|uniref:D-aspartate oxidase n=1 Tax=Guyanagaster necrorhizus TaxID=856835 RepID=A0A9P7VUT9_9AGAR|nr:D-aspartate oxidase [Guyanagaster necrorhizus MCA 3950]KAG7446865.1 D-aspartate oxidase [Guyanagaster necrorhizus MCA 3950]